MSAVLNMIGPAIDAVSHYAMSIAGLIGAVAVIWKVWVKPARDRIMQAVESVERMADLVTTEFKTNGGSTIKDAVVQTLEWQREHDAKHAEQPKRPVSRAPRAARESAR